MTTTRAYHHGDLRRALLDAAVQAIGEAGPAALSLRDLARRAGVSHAAPAHHFGDKTGLLTALAAEGFALLADELDRAGDDLLEAGVAYVRFAVAHRAHFEVMFSPDLHRVDDPALVAARTRAGAALRGGVATVATPSAEPERDALAAWSIVHGFATLWLAGALPASVGPDPEAAARSVIRRLFW
ncbi:TetR/AcrR family transcriptional regulator [Micromonospora sp. DR5-3]|uniref:TetR/AcrR family transcriptional regulator n=1 Tax=unclassified Micromonospora TaxID=2617518 RepID=UPI0011D97750|nr:MULTISPECIES: TetR/AcrR family transcriptional regulator [unclassified Micromonospora]MCW3815324.1 TetR/AcrR family transcriptional regulator [Micromonospora sp. DR5-3]TYC19356.1 TetR/AcrR family transcriptional regulator [Micromonospora sp. MP36]